MHFGVVFLVFSSLELFGHWYLFWSDVVASAFAGARFPGVHGHRPPEVCESTWSLWGSRVYAPHGCMGLMAGYAACCTPYIRHFPLVPVQRWSIELPATTVGERRRRRSLRRHKGGLWTVLFLPPRIVAGWFLIVTFKVSPYLTKYWSGLHPKLEGRGVDSSVSDGRATAAWHKRGHGHAREGR